MKDVHVECYPDGLLVSKLGFTKKKIIHSYGKSRVLKKISKSIDSLGMVDEDPGISNHPYEKNLRVVQEKNGLKLYTDSKGNKVIELKEKLENWILTVCVNSNIDPRKYSLPSNPKKLHDEINYKLDKFENLIEELLRVNNPAILQLKSWLR